MVFHFIVVSASSLFRFFFGLFFFFLLIRHIVTSIDSKRNNLVAFAYTEMFASEGNREVISEDRGRRSLVRTAWTIAFKLRYTTTLSLVSTIVYFTIVFLLQPLCLFTDAFCSSVQRIEMISLRTNRRERKKWVYATNRQSFLHIRQKENASEKQKQKHKNYESECKHTNTCAQSPEINLATVCTLPQLKLSFSNESSLFRSTQCTSLFTVYSVAHLRTRAFLRPPRRSIWIRTITLSVRRINQRAAAMRISKSACKCFRSVQFGNGDVKKKTERSRLAARRCDDDTRYWFTDKYNWAFVRFRLSSLSIWFRK